MTLQMQIYLAAHDLCARLEAEARLERRVPPLEAQKLRRILDQYVDVSGLPYHLWGDL